MKTKDIVTIGSVALTTTTLIVTTFLPTLLDADSGDNLTGIVTKPKLIYRGVEITLAATEHGPFKSGDEPVFELKACNTNNELVEVNVRVSMTSIAPGGMMSRMGPMPRNLWQDVQLLTLKPHETKSVTLATNTKLPANSTINVVLQSVDPKTVASTNPARIGIITLGADPSAIVALSYSTRVPAGNLTQAGSVLILR